MGIRKRSATHPLPSSLKIPPNRKNRPSLPNPYNRSLPIPRCIEVSVRLDRLECYQRIIAMGRSIVFSKNTSKKQLQKSLRRGIQVLLAVACVSTICLDSQAQAQLRTGRDAPRDYYPQNSSAQVPRPSSNPLRSPSESKIRKTKSSAPRNLEAISDDPPAEDLPQLSDPDLADSLPVVLATKKSSNSPVVTEVAPANFESPRQSTRQSSPESQRQTAKATSNQAVSLASGQAATRQQPAYAGNVIKRVTPSRVVSDHSTVIQSDLPPSTVIDPIESGEIIESQGDMYSDSYVVDDPTIHSGHNTSCGDPACTQCEPGYPTLNIRIGFPPLLRCDQLSARVEAATFWPSSQTLPALVRTAEIGTPGSTDLFGGTQNLDQSVQGIRGEFGYRFGFSHCNTLQFRFFDAGAQSLTFDSPRSSATSIVRPYQDGSQNPIVQDALSIKEPGISNGSVLAHAYSDVQGGDILFKRLWLKNCDASTEWLVGYQNTRLTDSIDVHSTTIPIGSTNLLELRDQFRAVNQFNGATFGLSRIAYSPRWSLGSMFKLGMGDLQRDVTISGFQKVGNAPATTNGLLARSPANGFYSTNTFVFSPEVNVTLGYRLTQNLEATVGYTYLGLPKVARAGEQIDTVSDLDSASPTRPRFTLQESNFSLHSLNYGLQYRY